MPPLQVDAADRDRQLVVDMLRDALARVGSPTSPPSPDKDPSAPDPSDPVPSDPVDVKRGTATGTAVNDAQRCTAIFGGTQRPPAMLTDPPGLGFPVGEGELPTWPCGMNNWHGDGEETWPQSLWDTWDADIAAAEAAPAVKPEARAVAPAVGQEAKVVAPAVKQEAKVVAPAEAKVVAPAVQPEAKAYPKVVKPLNRVAPPTAAASSDGEWSGAQWTEAQWTDAEWSAWSGAQGSGMEGVKWRKRDGHVGGGRFGNRAKAS